MRVERVFLQRFVLSLTVVMVLVGLASPVVAQGLHVGRLTSGTEVLIVAEPLSDATTLSWPDGDERKQVTSGTLTLTADLEEAFAADNEPAPAVVMVVGGAPIDDVMAVLERLLGDRPLGSPPVRAQGVISEGRLDRRLGTPGSQAEVRIEVPLPPPDDPYRTTIEVLWSLVPAVFSDDLEGVRSRIEGDVGRLEARTEPELADVAARQLRTGLARIAADPRLQDVAIETAARRLRVRRYALLEQHPEGCAHLLDLWINGGTTAVREFLFGSDGVTPEGVREAARRWLPQNPGRTVLVLPPRTFNPRFASPPELVQLESGLSAAILERPGTVLATVCLRPVMIPDFDQELAATILARLARELRSGESGPAWARVTATPPMLEVAAQADGFGELSELLIAALRRLADDDRSVSGDVGDPERRALQLMAGLLGTAEGTSLTPASLLREGNLALGIVADDGEAAADALRKFWRRESAARAAPTIFTVAPVPRTRIATAGSESTLVVAIELATGTSEANTMVTAELLERRVVTHLDGAETRILRPFVPGRKILLLIVRLTAPFDTVESLVAENWTAIIAPANEEELSAVRRFVAARTAASWSGSSGRSRRCAAVAAGEVVWRNSTDLEMEILSTTLDEANSVLSGVGEYATLQTTGAGVMPIAEPDAHMP